MIRVPGGRTGGEWGNPVRQRLFAEGVSRRPGRAPRPRFSAKDRRGGPGVRAAALPALIWARQAIIRRCPNTPPATGSRSDQRCPGAGTWQTPGRGGSASRGCRWKRRPETPRVPLPRTATGRVTAPRGRGGAGPRHRPSGARVPPGASCQPVPGSSWDPRRDPPRSRYVPEKYRTHLHA